MACLREIPRLDLNPVVHSLGCFPSSFGEDVTLLPLVSVGSEPVMLSAPGLAVGSPTRKEQMPKGMMKRHKQKGQMLSMYQNGTGKNSPLGFENGFDPQKRIAGLRAVLGTLCLALLLMALPCLYGMPCLHIPLVSDNQGNVDLLHPQQWNWFTNSTIGRPYVNPWPFSS